MNHNATAQARYRSYDRHYVLFSLSSLSRRKTFKLNPVELEES